MIGAIIGDVVGSRFEWNNIKKKDFELFTTKDFFTDDTVMTIAVCDAILGHESESDEEIKKRLVESMKKFGRKHLDSGFGGRFFGWLTSEETKPYNSYGNGSAMRVSPCGWLGNSMEEVERLARLSAEVTHNHEEGIKGAVSIALAIFMLRTGSSKEEVYEYIHKNYYKSIDRKLDDIREGYEFDETCQGSVPESFMAFFEAKDFEDTIRNAISLGGDSDTIAAIAGSLAEAYYGVPEAQEKIVVSYLSEDLIPVFEKFRERKKEILSDN